jgi:hypothetical protein
MNKADDRKVKVEIAQGRRRMDEPLERHPVVSEREWLKQQLALMEKEKQYIRIGDERRGAAGALPWLKIEKSYIFTSPERDMTLADLFKQHRQLSIKHFMMEPNQEWQCQGCYAREWNCALISCRVSCIATWEALAGSSSLRIAWCCSSAINSCLRTFT